MCKELGQDTARTGDNDHRDILDPKASCSPCKAGGERRKEGHLKRCHLSSQVIHVQRSTVPLGMAEHLPGVNEGEG